MITNATVAYVKTKEQAEEITAAWAKVRAQTAGSEEHVMVALVDPQVELLERQNQLLERIAVALERTYPYGYPVILKQEEDALIRSPDLSVPLDTPKPKKAKK